MTITLARHAQSAITMQSRHGIWRPPHAAFDVRSALSTSQCALESTWRSLQERRFDRLRAAFVRQGGLVSADDVSALLRGHWDQPISRVARWIAFREVLNVTWQGQVWLPLFQFERSSLDIIPAVSAIVRDLRPVYDDWELAEWFARPHDVLGGSVPAAQVACNPGAVREAARLDRFVNRW